MVEIWFRRERVETKVGVVLSGPGPELIYAEAFARRAFAPSYYTLVEIVV